MSTHILRIDSSPRTTESKTRELADLAVAQFPDATLTTRDVSAGLPVISSAWTGGAYIDPSDRTPAQADALALSDKLVAELMAADTLVIGAPMYNFMVPAALKLWFDQVARKDLTFRYTENGPEGLLSDKRAIVLVATGGVPMGSLADLMTPYIRHFLGFLGITDISVYAADGLMGPQAEQSLADAKSNIAQLKAA